MNAHLFLITRSRSPGRWQEAFPNAAVVHQPSEALRQAGPQSLIWIEVTRRNWMAELRAQRPELPLVALTLNPSTTEGVAAFEAGARGYCHALAAPEMLRQVALVVSNGGLWLGTDLMSRAAKAIAGMPASASASPSAREASTSLDTLSPRERAVALQVAGGASNKEVARTLDITLRTVKAHMGAIFDKLGVRDRLQLVLLLREATRSS